MKKMKSFILALGMSGFIALTGCRDVQTTQESNAQMASSMDEVMSYTEFKSRTYQEPETGIFILNGDEAIESEEQLHAFYQRFVAQEISTGQGRERSIVHQVNGVDAIWTTEQKKNLTYCISDSFGTHKDEVITAMNSATAAWEASAHINFIYQASEDSNCHLFNNNVVFDVSSISGKPYLARAFFPNYHRYSRNILIDDSSFTTSISLTGILRHELGHTLGLRHEHIRPEAEATECSENSNWRPLTPYDQASVMHYPQCNGISSWALELTDYDRQGISSLYNPPPPSSSFQCIPRYYNRWELKVTCTAYEQSSSFQYKWALALSSSTGSDYSFQFTCRKGSRKTASLAIYDGSEKLSSSSKSVYCPKDEEW